MDTLFIIFLETVDIRIFVHFFNDYCTSTLYQLYSEEKVVNKCNFFSHILYSYT